MDTEMRDEELEKRLCTYDGWVREGKIPTSSKVIPVNKAMSGLQWVLPSQQALEILRNSRSYAVADCQCKTTYKRCDNPREVCFYINDVADKKVALGAARSVTLEEAAEILELANAHGLIHLTIYNPEQHVYALCSCCSCCCHDIAFMKKYGRPDLVAHADYIAVTDMDLCTQCGLCEERCAFGARAMADGVLEVREDRCLGCGLCATTCPAGAVRMVLRR